jgi:hypothetical protein
MLKVDQLLLWTKTNTLELEETNKSDLVLVLQHIKEMHN